MNAVDKIWEDLCGSFETICNGDFIEQRFYVHICEWLVKNKNHFSVEVWRAYKLENYSAFDPYEYAVESMESSVTETMERFVNLKPTSSESIALIIRNVLWDMVAYKTEVVCSNCKDDCFRVLLDPVSNELVLSCDLCSCAKLLSGGVWSGCGHLLPAKKVMLAELFVSRISEQLNN